jgi:hypothetical protein
VNRRAALCFAFAAGVQTAFVGIGLLAPNPLLIIDGLLSALAFVGAAYFNGAGNTQ